MQKCFCLSSPFDWIPMRYIDRCQVIAFIITACILGTKKEIQWVPSLSSHNVGRKERKCPTFIYVLILEFRLFWSLFLVYTKEFNRGVASHSTLSRFYQPPNCVWLSESRIASIMLTLCSSFHYFSSVCSLRQKGNGESHAVIMNHRLLLLLPQCLLPLSFPSPTLFSSDQAEEEKSKSPRKH